jgi:ATP-dependent phosphoenolpyruvate carboxykinase
VSFLQNQHRFIIASLIGRLIDKNKALVKKSSKEEQEYAVYYVDGREPSSSIALDTYRRLSLELRREHLTSAQQLFMHDCAVGAVPSSRNNLRIITNDAAYALYAR